MIPDVRLYESGHVAYTTYVDGVGVVTERFYPLCGNAVQTEVFAEKFHQARVRPDTYTKRTVLEKFPNR
jgi:hypothetical protein